MGGAAEVGGAVEGPLRIHADEVGSLGRAANCVLGSFVLISSKCVLGSIDLITSKVTWPLCGLSGRCADSLATVRTLWPL